MRSDAKWGLYFGDLLRVQEKSGLSSVEHRIIRTVEEFLKRSGEVFGDRADECLLFGVKLGENRDRGLAYRKTSLEKIRNFKPRILRQKWNNTPTLDISLVVEPLLNRIDVVKHLFLNKS